MRKTARPVVWEGDRAQFRSLYLIRGAHSEAVTDQIAGGTGAAQSEAVTDQIGGGTKVQGSTVKSMYWPAVLGSGDSRSVAVTWMM